MSWLARSIANSLKLDDDEDDENPNANPKSPLKSDSGPDQYHPTDSPSQSSLSSSSSTPTARGVKEDLSELKNTLTRQLWGVASFLAPAPDHSASHSQVSDLKPDESFDTSAANDPSGHKLSEEDLIAGIRSDIAEISGKFKTGISKLSSNKTVSEFTKIASNFLQFGSEESLENYQVGSAVGITEEVLTFVKSIVLHPETWLDFPISYDDDDSDDFELSDAQQEHALALEHLVPRLAALRMELCPQYMSEDCFWKIYFVVLHPILNKHDAERLSSPHILEARAQFQESQQHTKALLGAEKSRNISSGLKGSFESPKEEFLSVPSRDQSEPQLVHTSYVAAPSSVVTDVETDKHPIKNVEIQVVDKPVIEEIPSNQNRTEHSHSGSSKVVNEIYVDDGDDWLKEETLEIDGDGGTDIPIGNDEDVSFSDLEEDDQESAYHKKVTSGSDTSTKDSRDWVQLSRNSADSDKDISSFENKHVGSGQGGTHKESNDWLDVDDIDTM